MATLRGIQSEEETEAPRDEILPKVINQVNGRPKNPILSFGYRLFVLNHCSTLLTYYTRLT